MALSLEHMVYYQKNTTFNLAGEGTKIALKNKKHHVMCAKITFWFVIFLVE